jgi:hypothetical protein
MDSTFISSLKKTDANILMAAAEDTGVRIRIKNKNHSLKGCVSVHTLNQKQDHRDLWIRYHEMKGDTLAKEVLCGDYFCNWGERW